MARTVSILFSNSDFFQWVVQEKEYRKQNWGMEIVKIMKIVDKVVKNWTRDSVTS